MILFPNCKINIGLHITEKRSDGFHNLETIFFPVPLTDALEVITNTEHTHDAVIFSSSGIPVPGEVSNNLCVKAWHLLKADFSELPAVRMHLHKNIPMGAGLGGGSSDGAHTLLLLNKKYNLQLSQQQLIHYALQLGSDCPFFIINAPCFAQGRGELMNPIPLNLQGYHLQLVNPGLHVNTGWAFSQITPAAAPAPLPALVELPVSEWKHLVSNDFEAPVCRQYPALETIKQRMYANGAQYAAMSGSGSTMFALYKPGHSITPAFPEYHEWIMPL